MSYTCPVCGYPSLDDPPRDAGGGGSYEICPSCNFEFGFTDDDMEYTYDEWRAQWIAKGMPWDRTGTEPAPSGWNPEQQLQRLQLDEDERREGEN
jgi:hypothetical protein